MVQIIFFTIWHTTATTSFVFDDWINVKASCWKSKPCTERPAWLFIVIYLTTLLTYPLQNHSSFWSRSFVVDIQLLSDISRLENLQCVCFLVSFFLYKLVSEVPCLVKELPQGLVALPLVADFSSGDAAGAGTDVGWAVLLTRVIQVAGLGSIQTVILSGHCRLTFMGKRGVEAQGEEKKGVENKRELSRCFQDYDGNERLIQRFIRNKQSSAYSSFKRRAWLRAGKHVNELTL